MTVTLVRLLCASVCPLPAPLPTPHTCYLLLPLTVVCLPLLLLSSQAPSLAASLRGWISFLWREASYPHAQCRPDEWRKVQVAGLYEEESDMQIVRHCVFIFKEPWPLWLVPTPATPSTALSRLPFCVSLGLWAEASKQCPQPCALTLLRGGVRGGVLTRGDQLTFLGDGSTLWCWRGPLPMAMLA